MRPTIDYDIWGPAYHPRQMTAGHTLYVALKSSAKVHMGINGWQDISDIETEDTGLGLHVAKLPTETLQPGDSILFTFFWTESGDWEGQNFEIAISEAGL